MIPSFFKKSSVAVNKGVSTSAPSGSSEKAPTNNSNPFDEIKSTDDKIKSLGAQKAKTQQYATSDAKPLPNNNMFKPEELVKEYAFRSGHKVADFGCGAGNIVMPLARFFGDGVEIYGVDVQKDLLVKMLREAKSFGLKNVFAVWGDIEKDGGSKLPDAQFDAVLFVNTLFQVENKQGALREAFRVLKKGGLLSVVDWKDSDLAIGPRKENLVNPDNLLELADSMGFVFNKMSDMGDHHYKIDFNKQI